MHAQDARAARLERVSPPTTARLLPLSRSLSQLRSIHPPPGRQETLASYPPASRSFSRMRFAVSAAAAAALLAVVPASAFYLPVSDRPLCHPPYGVAPLGCLLFLNPLELTSSYIPV